MNGIQFYDKTSLCVSTTFSLQWTMLQWSFLKLSLMQMYESFFKNFENKLQGHGNCTFWASLDASLLHRNYIFQVYDSGYLKRKGGKEEGRKMWVLDFSWNETLYFFKLCEANAKY